MKQVHKSGLRKRGSRSSGEEKVEEIYQSDEGIVIVVAGKRCVRELSAEPRRVDHLLRLEVSPQVEHELSAVGKVLSAHEAVMPVRSRVGRGLVRRRSHLGLKVSPCVRRPLVSTRQDTTAQLAAPPTALKHAKLITSKRLKS